MAVKKTKKIDVEKEFKLIGSVVNIGDSVELNYKDLKITIEAKRKGKIMATTKFNFEKNKPLELEGFEPISFNDACNLVIESQI